MPYRISRLALLLALAASAVLAQAKTTGFLTGKITGPDGIALPGVTVKATSPAMQGERTTNTVASGEFILRDLPAGVYDVELSLEGMATEKATVTVEIGRQDRLEVAMKPAAVSEEIVRAALGRLADGRTTVVIAHRLSTVRDADRIVVLDEGRVVEAGPHGALLARGGLYAHLVARQLTGATATREG